MPAADLPLLINAAREAAKIALRFWQTDMRVEYKDGGSPVSEADFAVDVYLRETLMAARPDYGWLSEETEDNSERLGKSRVFIVDPIDGTRAYVAGDETWAISIAVVEDGQPTAGVVYLPVRDKLYTAAIAQGAHLNGNKLAAGTRVDTDGANVLANKKAIDPKWWAEPAMGMMRHWRSALAYRFCLVAEDRFDAVITLSDAYEWDIAAGVLIAAEAGAPSSDREGAMIQFNAQTPKAPGVFTAPPQLHNRLIGLYTGRPAR